MKLEPHDLHFVFNNDSNLLKGFDPDGREIFRCEAHNAAVGGEGFGHYGRCPRGEFLLGAPVYEHKAAFGQYFTPILDTFGHHQMRDFGREGIGIHGGGTGLADPFAGQQGWQLTHGCIRVQNGSNISFVTRVKHRLGKGGKCYLTVEGE